MPSNPYGNSINITVLNIETNPTKGLVCKPLDTSNILLTDYVPSTPASLINRWRITLHKAIINMCNNVHINNMSQL